MKSLTTITLVALTLTASFGFVKRVNAENEYGNQSASAQEQVQNSTQPQACRRGC